VIELGSCPCLDALRADFDGGLLEERRLPLDRLPLGTRWASPFVAGPRRPLCGLILPAYCWKSEKSDMSPPRTPTTPGPIGRGPRLPLCWLSHPFSCCWRRRSSLAGDYLWAAIGRVRLLLVLDFPGLSFASLIQVLGENLWLSWMASVNLEESSWRKLKHFGSQLFVDPGCPQTTGVG
jgi:hypothetical protein